MTHLPTAFLSAAPRSHQRQTIIPVAIAAIATALVITVFAVGYRQGYADAWHELYRQPSVILRPRD